MGKKAKPVVGDPRRLPSHLIDHRASTMYLRCLAEARAHHASSKTYSGKFLRPHAPHIKRILEEFGGKSILDVGCGKGSQYTWVSHGEEASIPVGMTLEKYWGAKVFKYDPAWPPFETPPKPGEQYDVVLCTHVLGSIPVVDLDWFLQDLFDRSRYAVYIAEKIGPISKEVFSNPGQMPHGWTALDWITAIRMRYDRWLGTRDGPHHPKVWFVSREKTEAGVITKGGYL